jgi:hypothetical protein
MYLIVLALMMSSHPPFKKLWHKLLVDGEMRLNNRLTESRVIQKSCGHDTCLESNFRLHFTKKFDLLASSVNTIKCSDRQHSAKSAV